MTRGTLLCLLALAAAQLGYNAHQLNHLPADAVESCNVCLQFERTDDVLPAIEFDDSALDDPPVNVERYTPDPIAQYDSDYRSRAPPHIS